MNIIIVRTNTAVATCTLLLFIALQLQCLYSVFDYSPVYMLCVRFDDVDVALLLSLFVSVVYSIKPFYINFNNGNMQCLPLLQVQLGQPWLSTAVRVYPA